MKGTRLALPFVQRAPLWACDVIHAVSWLALFSLPASLLSGKRIIAHLPHDPSHAEASPLFETARKLVTLWIVRSEAALDRFRSLGLEARLVPYTLDERVFHHLGFDATARHAHRDALRIPRDAYVIGSFQRDTTRKDLRSPHPRKGPEVLAEAVHRAFAMGLDLHVLLAGPRRFWLLGRLAELGVPHTYLGESVPAGKDDVRVNTLERSHINLLYNTIDLYVVSSRSEGGPQAVIEAAATRCKIISTRVGHAPDLLAPVCLYDTPDEAAALIHADATRGALEQTRDANALAVERHRTPALVGRWTAAYARAMDLPPTTASRCDVLPSITTWIAASLRRRGNHWARSLARRASAATPLARDRGFAPSLDRI